MNDRAPISRASALDKPESLRESSRLLLLSNESIRARRRPFAVLAFGAWQVVAGLAIGWPAARTVAAVYENHPRGDAPLFEPGGFALVRTVLEDGPALRSITSSAIVVFLAASLLSLVPIITLFASLAHTTPDVRTPRARHLAPFVAGTYGSFAALWLGSALLKAVGAAIALAVFGALEAGLEGSLGDVAATKWAVAGGFVVALVIPAVEVVQDLTRAALVRYNAGLLRALRYALRTLRHGPRVLFSYAWRAVAGLVPIAAAAAFAGQFGGRGGGALLALFLLHQSVIFARAALRASWFARAIRAVDDATS
jgi:hypothetical protein